MSSPAESKQPTDTPQGTAARRVVAVDAFIDLVLESGTAPTPENIA